MNIAMFAWLTGWEIVLIFAVFLVLFGAKKLPELARGLGQGIKEFKKSTREIQEEIEAAVDVENPPRPPAGKLPPETQARTEEQPKPASPESHG